MVKEILSSNIPFIFVGVVILVGLIIMLVKRKKDLLAKAALYAVSKAQEAWGSDMGKVKFAEAYSYLKSKYPFITFFVSEAKLSQIIEDALAELKALVIAKAKKEESNGVQFEDMTPLTQSILVQTGVK